MWNITRAAAVGLLLLTSPLGLTSLVQAWGAEIGGIDIVTYGIYERAPGGDLRLVMRTDLIPAFNGDNFYVEYVVKGEPAGDPVSIEERVTLTPTGVLNPSGGDFFVKSRRQRQGLAGQLYLAGWGLRDGEYIEPGVWKVQLWHKGELMAEKVFNIALP